MAVAKQFIVNRQGKDFVLYAGLLDAAHTEGLKRISTKLLQAPSAENGQMAICAAEVETAKGIFTGIGDASPDNVGRMIAPHCIRMAETRAKARALRDAINVGVTAFEELGEVDEDPSEGRQAQGNADGRQLRAVPPSAPAATRSQPATQADGTLANAQQRDRLAKLQAALGRPALTPADLTSEAAATQIAELVKIFNSQARGGAR